jgi:Flp pilus assembly protein TadD
VGTRNGRTLEAIAALGLSVAIAIGAAAQSRRPVTAKVIGAEPNAMIFVDDIRFGRADATGTYVVSIPGPGPHTVLVRQLGFVDSTHPVVFSAARQVSIQPKKLPLKETADVQRQRGEYLLADGKFAEAISQFQAAIDAKKGDFPRAQVGLARALYGLKRFDDASNVTGQVLETNPKDIEARTVFASAYRDRGLYEEAVAEYRKAIALAPGKTPEAQTGLAVALDELGDHASAVEELLKGIAQNLDADPVLYHLLGAYYEKLDRRSDAIAAYNRFLELAPTHNLAPAVRSVLERFQIDDPNQEDEGDVNPYAPPS